MKNTTETKGLFIDKKMSLSNYRDLNNIKNMLNYQRKIQNYESTINNEVVSYEIGVLAGVKQKKFIFNFYSCMRYVYISEMNGKYIQDLSLEEKTNQINIIKEKMQLMIPTVSNIFESVFNDIIINYDSDRKNEMILSQDIKDIYPLLSGDEQIKFVEERIDALYTKEQRFKFMCSQFKSLPNNMGIPLGIIGLPGILMYTVLGESGLLKGVKYLGEFTEKLIADGDKVLNKIDVNVTKIKNKFK